MSLSSQVMVERQVTKSNAQYVNTSWDLVDAKKEGNLKVEDLKDSELPDEMKTMTVDQRKEYIDKMAKEREELQNKINKLNAERSKYVAKKMLENSNENTLDGVMLKAIHEQAVERNYKFEK